MISFKKGFTLLELLIAAAIIGVLAMFATQAFRRSAAEVRVQDAKTRADVLGAALARFLIDYPGVSFLQSTELGEVPATAGDCVPGSVNGIDGNNKSYLLPTLANCGYLERRTYLNGNFTWTVNSSGQVCVSAVENGKVASYWTKTYCTNGLDSSES